jgi:Skp family chaperone for outer membrane proteins
MKSVRLLVTLFSITLGCLSLSAQTPAAPAPAKPAAKKVFPAGSVAWINTQEFAAEETGIKQLVRVMKELELEFSGAQSELSLLNEKLRTIVGELKKLQADPVANADAIKAKQTEGLQIQQDLQGKQQQFQAAVQAAQQQKQGPIVTELTKALNTYAKDHDLAFVFDVSKLGDAGVYAKPELDITADFIAAYNAAHP